MMKSALFFLPFLSLLVGAIGTAIGSSQPQLSWMTAASWGVAAAIALTWIFLDRKNFSELFTRSGARYGASSGATLILGILVICGIGMLSTRDRFNKSFDVTKSGTNTLSDQSIKIIEKLTEEKAKVNITGFFQDNQVQDEFKSLLALYSMAGGQFEVDYIDPEKDPSKAVAMKITTGNTVIFRLNEQETSITTFNEEKVTNSLIKVLKTKTKKVYFTSGHGEGPLSGKEPNGYDLVVQVMKNSKYDVADFSLLEQAKVPEDADLVIVAGPKYDLKEEELRILEDFLKKGGALAVLVDAITPLPRLQKSLEKFGIKIRNDWLVLDAQNPLVAFLGQDKAIVNDFDSTSPLTKDFAGNSQVNLLFGTARSLEEVADNENQMKVELVGKTAEGTIRIDNIIDENDVKDIEQKPAEPGQYHVIAVSTGKASNPQLADNKSEEAGEGDQNKVKADTSGGLLDKKGEQSRLVVMGSSYFAQNQGAQQALEHRDLFVNMANFLLQDEDFISIRPKDSEASQLQLTESSAQAALLLLCFVYPFLFLGGGVVFFLQRRRA